MTLFKEGQLDQVKERWENSTVSVHVRSMIRTISRQKLKNGTTKKNSFPLMVMTTPHNLPLTLYQPLQAPGKFSLLAASETGGTKPAVLSHGAHSVLWH